MFDDLEPQKQTTNAITLGTDLSTWSIEDIDDMVERLRGEIARLEEERKRKRSSLDAAQEFFKS